MPAFPVHHTAMVDTAWDGPGQAKKIKTPVSKAARLLWAWYDADADQTTKGAFKFPHHMVGGDGSVGAGNVTACQSGIGVLNGGMGGSSIPASDRKAVYNHLAAHLRDAKVDPPDLKASPMSDLLEQRRLEQRREVRSQLHNVREIHPCPAIFELRETANGTGGSNVVFTGYASVTCANQDDSSGSYEMEDMFGPWTESVMRGAFAKTLRDKADVAFLVNHEGITLARTKSGTLKLSEDDKGLHTEARLDSSNLLVQQVRSGIERGDLDEMSFAFRVTRQEWDEDYTQRWITEVNMQQGDVSVVNYGANPHTGGLVAIRSAASLTPERIAAALSGLRDGVVDTEHRMTLSLLVRAFSDDDETADEVLDELVAESPDEPEDETVELAKSAPSAFDIARAKQRVREIERKYRRKLA